MVSTLATQPAGRRQWSCRFSPSSADPVFLGQAQDRFFNTSLDHMLRSRGMKTLALVGWRENGSLLYTAVGGTIRGYTVVVADDGTSAAQDRHRHRSVSAADPAQREPE